MSDKPKPDTRKSAPAQRDARLKSALKANLARRKAQMRARADGAGQTGADQTKENKD